MKNILLVLTVITLLSCVRSYPKIGDLTPPFIVIKIEHVGDGWCKYTGLKRATIDYNPMNAAPILVLKSGLFNIGDTIQIKNLK